MTRLVVSTLALAAAAAAIAAPHGAAAQAAAPIALPTATPGAVFELRRSPARIVILATGGTIAGTQGSGAAIGYRSGVLSVEALITGAPGLDALATLRGEQIANIGSQDMSDAVWLKLARRAGELLGSADVDGVVITHGTDTLEETAYFLDLVLGSGKPVVLVGSMRPATSLSADGPLNLYNAVAVAADGASWGRGVLVVLDDEVHAARDVQKMNTTAVGAFASPNRGKLGEVEYGKVTWFNVRATRPSPGREFALVGLDALPRVDIVYAAEGADGTLVRAAVAAGAKGIVLAGVGDGNATKEVIDALADAVKRGVVVVRSSRVGSGLVRRNVEVDDDALGFVAALELNPQKARVLLRLALTKTGDPAAIQRLFEHP